MGRQTLNGPQILAEFLDSVMQWDAPGGQLPLKLDAVHSGYARGPAQAQLVVDEEPNRQLKSQLVFGQVQTSSRILINLNVHVHKLPHKTERSKLWQQLPAVGCELVGAVGHPPKVSSSPCPFVSKSCHDPVSPCVSAGDLCYAGKRSIFRREPVASAIFSSVFKVKPSYSPLSILETACWLVRIALAKSFWVNPRLCRSLTIFMASASARRSSSKCFRNSGSFNSFLRCS